MDDPQSLLHYATKTMIDKNIDFINRYVHDPFLWTILVQKYSHLKRNSNTYFDLIHTMIVKVLPQVEAYILKRFGFETKKWNEMIELLTQIWDHMAKGTNSKMMWVNTQDKALSAFVDFSAAGSSFNGGNDSDGNDSGGDGGNDEPYEEWKFQQSEWSFESFNPKKPKTTRQDDPPYAAEEDIGANLKRISANEEYKQNLKKSPLY